MIRSAVGCQFTWRHTSIEEQHRSSKNDETFILKTQNDGGDFGCWPADSLRMFVEVYSFVRRFFFVGAGSLCFPVSLVHFGYVVCRCHNN